MYDIFNLAHRHRKRFLTLALSLLLIFGIAACGGNDEDPNNNNGNNNDPDPVEKETVTTTTLDLFDGPNMLESSDLADITVEGEDVFVYETRVNHSRFFSFSTPETYAPVAIFDFEGAVEVSITVPSEVELTSATVSPLAYDVEPTIENNTITFTLEYPTSYVVQYNDDPQTAIHLFTNTPEENTPDPDNLPDDMVYLGPGVHKADAIPLESGETLYIAGGALVYGQVRVEDVEDITIRGRGIISGEIYERRRASEYTIPIELRHSNNITIEGISILDPAGWTISSYFMDGLTLDNIKIITARANGDGISLQSSKNVEVKNSFVRSWDDSLVVKNYDRGTTENISFENTVVWTDLAQSMEIGYETYGETMTNISFKDITVINNFHKPVISIHNADDADISGVTYENITVENAEIVGDNKGESYDNFLIDFQIAYNLEWSSSGGARGSIRDVTIDNMVVLEGRDDVVGRIAGYSADHTIEDVSINHLTYKDTPVEEASDLNISINDYTDNISFDYDAEQSTGANVRKAYDLALEDDAVDITVHENIDQNGFLIPSFAVGETPSLYMGNQVTGDFTAQATRGSGLFDWDLESNFSAEGNPSSNVLDGDLNTKWVAGSFETDLSTEYAALSIDFDGIEKLGKVRIHGNPESEIYQLQNIAVFAVRSTSDSNTFVKLTNSEDYEFSPSKGNYADINFSPGEYKAIQLRFYNNEGIAYPEAPFAHGVELYPASLSYNKGVSATPHADVYEASNITDGNRMTYYESESGTWPAEVVINLADTYDVSYFSLHLPPLMQWEPREQTIEVLTSVDGNSYTTVAEPQSYSFDPVTGNVVEIELSNAVQAQYVKFLITSNTAPGDYGAQISEINIFE